MAPHHIPGKEAAESVMCERQRVESEAETEVFRCNVCPWIEMRQGDAWFCRKLRMPLNNGYATAWWGGLLNSKDPEYSKARCGVSDTELNLNLPVGGAQS